MDMELFSDNHARFISPFPVDENFLIENRDTFNFSHFKSHVRDKWNAMTDISRDLKIVS